MIFACYIKYLEAYITANIIIMAESACAAINIAHTVIHNYIYYAHTFNVVWMIKIKIELCRRY